MTGFLAAAQKKKAAPGRPSKPINVNDLVAHMVQKELSTHEASDHHWLYELDKRNKGKLELRRVVETSSTDLYCVLAINGAPLTPDERKRDDQRIAKFISDPEEQKKAREEGDSDSKQAREMFEAIPQAFLFSDQGRSGPNERIAFRPNPKYAASSNEAKVLHLLAGTLLIDLKQERMKQLSGRLVMSVKFGGGVLGHLDRGGTMQIQQTEAAAGEWLVSQVIVSMTGKMAIFKTIDLQQREDYSKFQQVPGNLTLAQAAELLRHEPSQPQPARRPRKKGH